MNVTVKARKVDEKNQVICLVSMFLSKVVVLTLSKKVHFFTILCSPQEESKSVKAIYIYASERSHYPLSHYVLFIML